MKKIVVSVAALALLVTGLFAADFNGKWTGEMEGRNGKRPVTLNLKVDGTTVTGTVEGGGPQGASAAIIEGKVTGDDISFAVEREMQGEKRKIPYTGKLVGDELKMKTGTGDREREFSVKKAVS
ncbi:MAG TPA: hypothetical protein VEQ63_05160 [Bryobacteraceae bacterium]|nr:hypothetical protein [Bryobacteraceae bacterium]